MTQESSNTRVAWWQTISAVLVWRMLLLTVLYTICRLIFYWYNRDLLAISGSGEFWLIMRGGLVFDLAAMGYVNALVLLLHILPFRFRYRAGYQSVLAWIYWIFNGLAIILNLGDTVYYRFTLKRSTVAVLEEFKHEDSSNFLYFFWEYWGITLTGIGLIALMVWIYKRIRISKQAPQINNWVYYPLSVLWLVAVALFTVASIRGGNLGADQRPITLSNAALFISQPQQRAMVLNTPFALIRTADKPRMQVRIYMPEEEAKKYFSAEQLPQVDSPYSGMFKGRNVVLIIWESFAREWVGKLNQDVPGYKGFTPFIDSLMDHSYYFEHAYANGRISVEAMPSMLASVPRPRVPFVLSPYSGNALTSLVAEVVKEGYHSAFFHNARNGSMGFDAFTHTLGFKDYYGRDNFNDDSQFDGTWGIWDMPFLQYMARTIDKLPQPFFATEFTTTSHSPFHIPKDKVGKYPEGDHPMHKCIGYTDDSLREFFAYAKKQPWYNNTLFVIVADHSISGSLDKYKTTEGNYRIPIIFFDPRGELVGKDSTNVVQQSDMMPTLMDLLGINRPIISFGNNMFAPSAKHFAVQVLESGSQMVMGDYLLLFDDEKPTALYNRVQDPMLKRNILTQSPEVVGQMLPILKAYLQEYTTRLEKNRLVVGR